VPPISVHVISEHGGDRRAYGCSHIRNLLPLAHPVNRPHLAVSASFHYAPADVVIVERAWDPHTNVVEADELVARTRADGACLVYTVDDALLEAPSIPLSSRTIVRTLCRRAAGVIVSTPFLQRRFAQLNPHVHVVPNALDERLFFKGTAEGARGAGERLVVGFMGTLTHESDLMLVVQPLRALLRRTAGTVEFQIVGGISDSSWLRVFDGLPVQKLKVPPESVEYPAFVGWMRRNLRWDIAIAPLADSPLNLGKSDIKFLDYSALGFPGVYSAAPAYLQTVHQGETGILASNSPAEWYEALERLVKDSALRNNIAAQSQRYVRSERTLEHRAAAWREAVETILATFRASRRH
jgi:glycosyltransferase involved in cell wall biosynthesis